MRIARLGILLASRRLRGEPGARREDLRLEREGQHGQRARRRDATRSSTPSRGCSGRAASPPRRTASTSTSAPPTTTWCGSTTRRPTRSCRACPRGRTRSSSCCTRRGNPLYIANEDDNIVTVVDVETRQVLAEVPVGVEPEGMGVSPDGKIVVNTSETTNMAHLIDTRDLRDRGERAGRLAAALCGVQPRRQPALRLGRDRRHGQRDRHRDERDRAQDRLRGAGRPARGAAAGRRPGDRGRRQGLRGARAGEPGGGGRRRDAGR